MPVVGILMAAQCMAARSATDWWCDIGPFESGIGGFSFGAKPGCQDGYDGQILVDISGAGIYMQLFRDNGPAWTGPTGFFYEDFESPIAPGGSRTWWDIRLWSHNYTPQMGNRVGTTLVKNHLAPQGWWGKLVLDYAPAHLNWTGATEWWFPLGVLGGYTVPALPVPITGDPWNPDNVTRLHLEVYTIPEPPSLAALGFALAGVGIGVARRRK